MVVTTPPYYRFHANYLMTQSTPSAAEFEYTFVEEEDENTFTPHIGKRVAKKDIIRAEIKLIERPGIHPHTSSSLSTCT